MSAPAAESPVDFPKLEHFSPLWERSIFTTKDLPAPETTGGPSFIDSLSLSGMYEIQGEVVAMIVDRATTMVYSTKIGSENELGIKIRKIDGEITNPKTRIQLQKGDQAGWLKQNDGMSDSPQQEVRPAGIPGQIGQPGVPAQPGMAAPRAFGATPPNGLPTRQSPTPAAAGLLLPPASGVVPPAPVTPAAPLQIPQSPLPQVAPAVSRPAPTPAPANDDIPLPPP